MSYLFSFSFLDLKRICKSAILFIAILFGLSPILRTLTLEISNDSIWAMSSFLFAVHLFLTDFTPSREVTSRFPATFSTNSAIFASVMLSSRLPSMYHVFALLLTSVALFALIPIFRRNLSVALPNPWIPFCVNFTLTLCSIQLFWNVSLSAVCAVLAFQCLLLLFSPIILLYAHDRYKSTFHGPWDEAILKEHIDLSPKLL
ncbi:hypothetical protein HMI54_007055 [Coelomomyces lativittatus]|nr:hypothetical protein HMI54_007055 [Coelomomyces lativittatus]